MSEVTLLELECEPGPAPVSSEQPFRVALSFEVAAELAFELDLVLDFVDEERQVCVARRQYRSEGRDASWLPRGRYRFEAWAPRLALPPGNYRIQVGLWHAVRGRPVAAAERGLPCAVREGAGEGPSPAFELTSLGEATPVSALSWRRGGGDWFHKHFDHAARTVMSYMLGDSPLLDGRILDVGCGDGITDLGMFVRRRPELLVGIDPFRGYERLLETARANHLPLERLPDGLEFLPADANAIPFPDDHFDVVVSWGSLEHIVGGYARALDEIRRVLRPDGLLFAHPGLYFSDIGNHLGEFEFARREPYVHLKKSPEELRRLVLGSEPDRMDRAGHVATPAEYWQWYTELNRITVRDFERELRDRGFEPWRAAIRTHERVDYTPELLPYAMQDLAEGELYVSAYNRKPARR